VKRVEDQYFISIQTKPDYITHQAEGVNFTQVQSTKFAARFWKNSAEVSLWRPETGNHFVELTHLVSRNVSLDVFPIGAFLELENVSDRVQKNQVPFTKAKDLPFWGDWLP